MNHDIKNYTDRRLPSETIRQIRGKIREMKSSGKTYEDMVTALNKDGFQTAYGKPINIDYLRNQIWRMRKLGDLPVNQHSNHPTFRYQREIIQILRSRKSDKLKIVELKNLLIQGQSL